MKIKNFEPHRNIILIDVSKKGGVKLIDSNTIYDKPIGYVEPDSILKDIFIGFGKAYNNN